MANVIGEHTIKANLLNNSEPIKSTLTTYGHATTEVAGIIRIATDEEANLGISDNTAITPHTLKAKADYLDNKIGEINTTLSGFGNIVTHNVPEFATASQGAKADTALQPNDKISLMDNDAGYISAITSLDVTTALGYTPYNATNPNGYQANIIEDIKVNDVSQSVIEKSVNIIVPTVNNATLTIQKNSTDVGTFTSNASVDKIINIPIPTNASDVNALPNSTKYGASIDLSLNTTDYKLTITLKDQNGDALNSKVVDFPIESVVVNGSYDDNTQKIILTLQNGNTIEIPVGGLISGLQTEITSNNKLDADLIDDSSSTNKLVTANDKQTWNGKQDAISDLSTIRSNAENGQSAYTTISGYGDIPTHNVSEFATAQQGSLADTSLQDGTDVINALGYIPQQELESTVNIKSINGQSILGSGDLVVTASGADTSLSNLTTAGENRLHALKGYTESGQVYSDAQLYNDVLTQYHGTFDLSKFTVTGTPTITDNGIASGFSSSNKISASLTLTGSKLVAQAGFYYKVPSASASVIGLMNSGTSCGRCYVSTSGNIVMNAPNDSSDYIAIGSSDITLTANDFIIATLELTENSTFKLTVLDTNTNETITKTSTANWNKTVDEINSVYFGSSGSSEPYESSIDLKTYSITVDGVEVFSGHKTGTDLIITDNYTVVGTPTITDGVMSNIHWNTAQGGYATTGTFLQNLGNYDTWEIEIPVTFRSSWDNNFDNFLYDGTDSSNYAIIFQINNAGRIRIYLKAEDNTNISYGNTSTDTFSGGESVTVKPVFTGTQYILYTKKPNENWKAQITINSTKKLKVTNHPFLFGVSWRYQEDWGGSIDLYGIRFIGNNKLIYACKCQIPYNISDSGNKIADVQYRPDVYYANYLGYKSSYLTIDTTNQNVTLPYTDVYGLINQSLDYNYKLIQGYNANATQTLKHVNGVLQWVSDV